MSCEQPATSNFLDCILYGLKRSLLVLPVVQCLAAWLQAMQGCVIAVLPCHDASGYACSHREAVTLVLRDSSTTMP